MRLGEARTPEGMRIYAVGDVHGCHSMLAEMHDRIVADVEARPVADHRVIHIGDYGDRGPNSAAVIERLVGLTAGNPRVVCLRGNHDVMLTDFLDDPARAGSIYMANGGAETLRSYGVNVNRFAWLMSDYPALARQLKEKMPAAHVTFLKNLPLTARFGDYFFCHAGIRPGVPLDEQDAQDLVWIREEFLLDESDHGVVVIHGHTPAREPDVRSNRINVDTGAVYGGTLTCLALEGSEYRFL